MRSAEQRVHSPSAGYMGHQSEADLLTGVEHRPSRPRCIACVTQPGAQVRIAHNQRQDRRCQRRRDTHGGMDEDGDQHRQAKMLHLSRIAPKKELYIYV